MSVKVMSFAYYVQNKDDFETYNDIVLNLETTLIGMYNTKDLGTVRNVIVMENFVCTITKEDVTGIENRYWQSDMCLYSITIEREYAGTVFSGGSLVYKI